MCSTAEVINWLVIGIGDITRKRVIPAILADRRSSLYAVLTRNPAKAEAYSGTCVFTSLEEALADPKIDAVYVASPVLLHAAHTIASLRAGKHVVCEKPVAMNFAEAEAMATAAREAGRLLGVAYFRRLYPKVVRAQELLKQGAIGKPTFAFACYHSWLESEERGWLRDPALAGGGPFYDVASHRIDMCNLLFGTPGGAVGLLSNAVHQFGVEDAGTAAIRYAEGVHAVVDVRWNSRIQRDEFRVIGVDGELDLTPLNGPRLRMIRANVEACEESYPTHANVHFPIIENFVAAALDGAPLACPIDQAIQTDWVTERIFRK